jgi:hypothetical protein
MKILQDNCKEPNEFKQIPYHINTTFSIKLKSDKKSPSNKQSTIYRNR